MVELADRLRAYVANLARDIGERNVFLPKALHEAAGLQPALVRVGGGGRRKTIAGQWSLSAYSVEELGAKADFGPGPIVCQWISKLFAALNSACCLFSSSPSCVKWQLDRLAMEVDAATSPFFANSELSRPSGTHLVLRCGLSVASGRA